MGKKLYWLTETVVKYEVAEVLECLVWPERLDQQMSGKLKSLSKIVLGMVEIDSKY